VIGKTVGNYKILAQIGEGGMGAVFLAEHPLIGKKVAVKVLHAELSRVQDAVSRFFTEARAVNAIGHENIIDIADFGSTPEGETYFIMELLEGDTLAQRMRRTGPMQLPLANEIMTQVCSALSAAHAHGIVHRDLKPDNIFLCQRGGRDTFVKVLDFGIAKLIVDTPGSAKTRTGVVIGTPHYMSPEQCTGKGIIDARSDIYSVGLILYEMLTGRLPFEAESFAELLVAHLTQAPTPPRALNYGIPDYVQTVILRCLEKDRDKRYSTIDEVSAALISGSPGAVAGMEAPTAVGMPPMTGSAPAPIGATVAVPTPVTGVPLATAVAPVTATPPIPQTTMTASAGQMETTAGSVAPPPKKSIMPLALASAVGGLAIVAAAILLTRGADQTKQPAEAAAAAAPAPVEAPAPAPAAPAPAAQPVKSTVSARIESTPKGASVYRRADRVLLGQTPVTLDLPKANDALELDLKLAGHVTQTTKVTPDRDLSVSVVMPRERAPEPKPVRTVRRRTPRKKAVAKPAPADTETKKRRVFDKEGTLEPEF